jgi:hypothetical protein
MPQGVAQRFAGHADESIDWRVEFEDEENRR